MARRGEPAAGGSGDNRSDRGHESQLGREMKYASLEFRLALSLKEELTSILPHQVVCSTAPYESLYPL